MESSKSVFKIFTYIAYPPHLTKIFYKPNISDCGIPNRADANKRIVGGQKAETGEFPWQVAILFGGPELYRQVRLEHSHWSRPDEILCSDWLDVDVADTSSLIP